MVTAFNIGKGLHQAFYENGSMALEGYIFNIELFQIGKWKEWYKNGQLKREYSFKEDEPNVKEGIWKWWDIEGNLIKEESY